MILDFDRVQFQRARQFDATPRNKGMRSLRLQHGIGGNALGWLHDLLVIGRDETCFDRGLRPCPAFEQTALDQQQVRAFAGGGFAAAFLRQVQLDAGKAGDAAKCSAASLTQASNVVRSRQMSAGTCAGVCST